MYYFANKACLHTREKITTRLGSTSHALQKRFLPSPTKYVYIQVRILTIRVVRNLVTQQCLQSFINQARLCTSGDAHNSKFHKTFACTHKSKKSVLIISVFKFKPDCFLPQFWIAHKRYLVIEICVASIRWFKPRHPPNQRLTTNFAYLCNISPLPLIKSARLTHLPPYLHHLCRPPHSFLLCKCSMSSWLHYALYKNSEHNVDQGLYIELPYVQEALKT